MQQLKVLLTRSTIWRFALAPHINQILHLAQGAFIPFPACSATCAIQTQEPDIFLNIMLMGSGPFHGLTIQAARSLYT